MSIINDALKKLQQRHAARADETTPAPLPVTPAQPNSGYIYSTPAVPPEQANPQTPDPIPPKSDKAKSILALFCAIVITLAAFGFFFKQLNKYFPQMKRSAKSTFYKLIHKKEVPDFKTRAPADLKPLAQITINPTPNSQTAKPPAVTLNIHGIMSNGTGNLVLINDQVYQEGDEVEGAKIVKINLDSITVINNGVEQTIPVKG